MLEGRLGRERWRLFGAPEDTDHPPHLRQRLASRLLDDKESLALALLLGPKQPAHRGGLHRHDADAVADEIVQFSRDPRALLAHRGACPFLPLPLGPGSPLSRLVRFLELAAERECDRPDDAEDDDRRDEAPSVPKGSL